MQYTLSALVGLCGAYLLWRATQIEGPGLTRVYIIGLGLQLLAVLTAAHFSSSAHAAREEVLEDQLVEVRRSMQCMRRRMENLEREWDDRKASAAVRVAVDRADVHRGRRGWVTIVRDDAAPGS